MLSSDTFVIQYCSVLSYLGMFWFVMIFISVFVMNFIFFFFIFVLLFIYFIPFYCDINKIKKYIFLVLY